MRILFFTGKGGVGKTSVAAATAMMCAASGYKTIVMSTDPAHSLGDSFDVELSGEPKKLAANLHAIEIDVHTEMKKGWKGYNTYLSKLLSAQGIEEVMAKEMVFSSGLDELSGIMKIKEFHDEKKYDVLIIDCAPTGETMRWLNFPNAMEWYMRRIYGVHRKVLKVARPTVGRFTKVPLPTDDFLDDIRRLYEKTKAIHNLLLDPKVTSIRLVMNPEKMVIKETQRAFTYFSVYGYPVDCLIANRVMPPEADGNYFSRWKDIQQKYMTQIEEMFAPHPVFKVKMFDREVVGSELLSEMGKAVYGGKDPAAIFYSEKPLTVSKKNKEYILSLKVPFTEKDELELEAAGGELALTAGKIRKVILLPQVLIGLSPQKAEFKDGRLTVRFAEEA